MTVDKMYLHLNSSACFTVMINCKENKAEVTKFRKLNNLRQSYNKLFTSRHIHINNPPLSCTVLIYICHTNKGLPHNFNELNEFLLMVNYVYK